MKAETVNTELRKQHMKALKASRTCMYPNCAKPAIKSHLLQKNGILNTIATDGHIYSFQVMPFGEQGWDIKRDGLNDAFTFLGFCTIHDNQLFAPIEKAGFEPKEYQSGLLLSYRGMCNERRKKEVIVDARERFLRIKKIEDLAGVKLITDIKDEIKGNNLGIKDNLHYEEYFIPNISALEPEEFTFKYRELPKTEICISGVYTFETTEQLAKMDISENNYEYPSEIYINCFPFEDKSILILGSLNSVSQDCKNYIDNFIAQNDEDIFASLSQLMIYEVESWSCSEKFYLENIHPRIDTIKQVSYAQHFNVNERITPELNVFIK